MASPKWRETFHRLTTETVARSTATDDDQSRKKHKRPLHGGRLDEVQSLVWHWLLTPEDACLIVDFPIEHYREWDADRGEPPYLPSPAEIARVSGLIATGKVVVGGDQGKVFKQDPDEFESNEDELLIVPDAP